ncbi:Aldo keto reductase [Mycena albidolilacea]|uniref:Aldo keto reductase n=1 Tax=Mycena albidolilacea TaxID=1033008 RepID=A0AAD7AN83_9AGAR|nr:Aldo keto reductase [Mycena albidolilacea]
MEMERKTNKMSYVRLGNSGLKVSRLILGTMQYGSNEWQPWILSESIAIEHIKAAYDLGIQTFDTADIYSNGITEVVFGNAIKALDLPREEIVIMTKIKHHVPKSGPSEWFLTTKKDPNAYGYVNQGGLSRKHIFDGVKASLKRLQVDYIDVLQCHGYDKETPVEETMTALHDIIKLGWVRYIGMGSCYAWQFHAMQNYAINNKLTPFISMQHQYNLLYRDDEVELIPTLKHFGIGSIPFSGLARGHLSRPLDEETERSRSDRFYPLYKLGPWSEDEKIIKSVEKVAREKDISMAQVALAWVLQQPMVTAPIIGPTSISQLEDLIGAINVSLSTEEIELLEAAYRPRPPKLVSMALSI